MLELKNFQEADEIVKKVVNPTKLVFSEYYSEQTGNKIYLKPENMQLTGCYKIRGNFYRLSLLSEEEKKRGVVTASGGNHGLAIACASKKLGIDTTVVMPSISPIYKVNTARNYGVNIVLDGNDFEEAYERAKEIAEETGALLIHPFDDLQVVTGQGTIAKEILEELPDADYILVPVGGGGLMAGVATYAKLLKPDVKIIGVLSAGADCVEQSLKNGEVTYVSKLNTIADGVAVKEPGMNIFPYLQKNIDEIIKIDDSELIVAFLDMVENHKMIVENAGLLPIAALKHMYVKDKKIVSLLSGGNMDVITMSSIVQHGLIQRDRIFTVSVLLPDKPGELTRVSDCIAKESGNVIKLEHNQFVSTNRNAAVELRITMEAYGTEHKDRIIKSLRKNDYRPKVISTIL